MDHRGSQHGTTVAVNAFPQAPPYLLQQHLHASFVNELPQGPQYSQHPPPRQRPVLLSQQPSFQFRRVHHPAAHQQSTIMNPVLNNDYQPFAPGYSREDAKAMLTSDFDDSMFAFDLPSVMPTIYHHPPSHGQQYSFRPLERAQVSSFGLQPPALKIDTDQVNSIMPWQTSHVDTRRYSPVSLEEVFNTPVEPSSPSSIDTDDSPMTPALDHHATFFNHYTAKYGELDARFYPTVVRAPSCHVAGQTSFGSLSSSSSSYPSSSFSASSFAPDHHHSEQPRGLAMNYTPTYEAPAAFTTTDPVFDPHVLSSDLETLADSDTDDDDASLAAFSLSSAEAAVRNDRDKLLLDMRNQGFSYKDIKRIGNFKEAESTLRGRMRVLTKEKHERVRRPVWRAKDVRLLRGAVEKCTGDSSRGSRRKINVKMPWLKISTCIQKDGASYPFAPATCARKWMEIGGK